MSSESHHEPLRTGYTCFDQLTGGLHPGELAVLTGDLAVEFALNLVDRIGVRSERAVLLCSGGTSKNQISERLTCCHAGIDSAMLHGEELDEAAWDTLREAAKDLYESPVFVEEARDLSRAGLRAKCVQMHSEYGIELLVLDLRSAAGMTCADDDRAGDGLAPDHAGKLKELAQQLGIAVVVYETVSGHDLGADEVERLEQRADLLLRVHGVRDLGADERMVECVAERDQVELGSCSLVFRTKSMSFQEKGGQ